MNSERVLESKLPPKEVPALCLSIFLLGRLLQHKDRHLIVDCATGCLWTGREIYDACISLSDAFINAFDLNPGETICFLCPNSDIHAIALLATLTSGATYVPIEPDASYDDMTRVVRLSSAKFLVCLSDYLSEAMKAFNDCPSLERVFVIGGKTEHNLNDCSKNCHFLMQYMRYKYKPVADSRTKPIPIPVPVDQNDLCVIHFIRQTTSEGLPTQLLPVIKTHANLLHSSVQLSHAELFHLTNDDSIVSQHFSNYLAIVLFCHSLVVGSKFALIDNGLNRQESLQFVHKYRITSASIDLKDLLYLLRNDVEIRSDNHKNFSHLFHDFTSLVDVLHTSSPLPYADTLTEEVFTKLRPKHFRAIYGKAETGVISCVWKSLSTFEAMTTRVDSSSHYSVGYPVPGVQIKIIHPRTEKSRSHHKMGEICVKSKQVIEKSRNLSVVTRNVFTIDGFFKTGDAGYYDCEGLLYVECRVNELIYEDNDCVNPSDLEAILLRHSSVKEVAVIGVLDNTYGQISCAFVVLQHKQSVSEKTLLEFMSKRGKQLRAGIKFIDSIPRTLRSQVNRMALRQIYDNFHTFSLIEIL